MQNKLQVIYEKPKKKLVSLSREYNLDRIKPTPTIKKKKKKPWLYELVFSKLPIKIADTLIKKKIK